MIKNKPSCYSLYCPYHKYKKCKSTSQSFNKKHCSICFFSIKALLKVEPKIIRRISNNNIYLLCLLKDGRLVSGDSLKIVIYSRDNYQSKIFIKDGSSLVSLCALKNGNLASGDEDGKIKIYAINENNYHLIQTIRKYASKVNAIIELEDGRLCSSSDDGTIKIFRNNNHYEFIKTLKSIELMFKAEIKSILEINNYIISVDCGENPFKIWNKSTYKLIESLQVICSSKELKKLKDNEIIMTDSSRKALIIVNVVTFENKTFQCKGVGRILSICVLKEDKVLLGNKRGKIFCFDLFSSQIIYTEKVHHDKITCIIKNENNKIFSSSEDGHVNEYDEFYFSYKIGLL